MIYNPQADFLLALLTGVISSKKSEQRIELPEGLDAEALYRLAVKHNIENMLYIELENNRLLDKLPEATASELKRSHKRAFCAEAQQQIEYERLEKAFGDAGLDFLPLKGLVLKWLYPTPDTRRMSDIDILVFDFSENEVLQCMQSLGYSFKHKAYDHFTFSKPPVLTVEVHHTLMGQSKGQVFYDYFSDCRKRVTAAEGKKHVFKLSNEDFYIFMLAHMAKHFKNGGTGIRSVLDIAVFRHSYTNLDEEYIRYELEKLGLLKFAAHIEELAKIWFAENNREEIEKKADGFYKTLGAYIISCGAFGTKSNFFAAKIAEESENPRGGRYKYALRTFFPNRTDMENRYPWLKDKPLLPIAWVARICNSAFKKKGYKKAASVFTAEDARVKGMVNLFTELGLKQ